MKIAVASDHAGYPLKIVIAEHLRAKGYEVDDLGCPNLERADYPVYGEKAGRAVAAGQYERAVIVCGTGIGISMSANKVGGVRAAVCSDAYSAEMSRRHNDANILALGARVVGEGLALTIVDAFFAAEFEGGRHARRVEMINGIKP